MKPEVEAEYKSIEREFKTILRERKEIAKRILSSYLGLLTVYPDQPYGHDPVVNPVTGYDLVVPEDTSDFSELHEKDLKTLEIVEEKISQGGRVLIYTSWVRIDTQDKLFKLLTEHGYRVNILTTSVAPNKREEWVEKQVANGVQVLITNPSLVETGLDLNDFTTLIYYNIAYKLFTLRQASRRSWRINQRAPRIEVYFLYYRDTMQHRAIRLMASKLAVAGIIEGNFTDEGLAAMSECQDLTTALARELTLGIKNEVEDLGAVFKKMAILKPEGEIIAEAVTLAPDAASAILDNAATVERFTLIDAKDGTAESPFKQNTSTDCEPISIAEEHFLFLSNARTPSVKKTNPGKKKTVADFEQQITLFDFLAIASAS